MDEDDYEASLNANRKHFIEFRDRIKKDVREKGVSHCGQFTTEAQVDKAFEYSISTGLYSYEP